MGTMTLHLSDDVLKRLKKLAKATGKSETYYATEAICQYLDDLEDQNLAESRWRDLQEGRSTSIPLEEIVNQYALDDRT